MDSFRRGGIGRETPPAASILTGTWLLEEG
jgi:hypothetical protein